MLSGIRICEAIARKPFIARVSLLMPYAHVKTMGQRHQVSTLFLSVDAHPNYQDSSCQLQPTVPGGRTRLFVSIARLCYHGVRELLASHPAVDHDGQVAHLYIPCHNARDVQVPPPVRCLDLHPPYMVPSRLPSPEPPLIGEPVPQPASAAKALSSWTLDKWGALHYFLPVTKKESLEVNKEVRLKVPSEITFYARKGDQHISLSRENLEAIVGFLQGGKSTSPEQFEDLLAKNLIFFEMAPSPGSHDFDDVFPEVSPNAILHLSPFVNVEITFSINKEPMPHFNAAVINVFIPREFMSPWSALMQNLYGLADSMLKNALTRGKLPNQREILKVLHDVCIQECAKEPLSKFLEAKRDSEGKFQFIVKRDFSVQRKTCQYPEINFRLQLIDADLSERFINVSDEDCPYVARLFQKLNQGALKSELVEFAVKTPNPHALKRILKALKQLEGLISEPSATKPDWDKIMPPRADLSIYHFGHASLLVRGGSSFIAFDPWFLTWDAKYRTQPLSAFQLPPLEAILITHHHWDHISPESILQYPEGVDIIVPKQLRNCVVYPRYVEFLKLFGHEKIVELDHWEKYPLRDGGFVLAIPFIGEGTAEDEARRNCYLVERSGQRILVHADSSQDSNGKSDLTEGVIQKLVRDYGLIDIVYATRRQEMHFGIECRYLYPITMADRPYHWLDVIENCNCPKEYLASLAKETGCKKLILYSEGGAEWYTEGTNFLRNGKEDVRFQAFEYLWDTFEDIRTEITKTSECDVELSEPMTLVTLEAGKITSAQRLLDSN